jgi:predicted  nucleic acid-binding Zn-ribbon protein
MKEILERFDQLAHKFDHLELKMDAGFSQVERRFEQVDQRFEKVDQRFEKIDQRFEKIDQRFEKVEGELAEGRERDRGFEARFDRLEGQLHTQGLLLESMNNDLKQTMEVVIGNREAMDRGFAEVMRKMDERVHPLELASRHFARHLPVAVKKRGRR